MNPSRLVPVLVGVALAAASPARGQTIAIEAGRIMTMSGQGTIGPAIVVVRDGKISAVGPARAVKVPADAVRMRASVVTPGLIDARTTLGLTGLVSAAEDQDERGGPNQAAIRALDAFRLDEPMLAAALRAGVTTVQSGPGLMNPIGGEAGVFKTSAPGVAEAVVAFPSAVVFSLTEAAKTTYGSKGRYPSTRMATVGLIRQALVDAGQYARRATDARPPARDLKLEALASLLKGDVPALIGADRADEIATALRLIEEFTLRAVLAGASEAGVLTDQLAASKVPVVMTPEGEAAFDPIVGAGSGLAARLRAKGVVLAYGTGDVSRDHPVTLLGLAASGVRGGLTPEQAIAAVTIDAARVLGVERHLGSLEAGKDADLVLFDGDPFVVSSGVVAVIVSGQVAHRATPR